jgi:hypothetical protein
MKISMHGLALLVLFTTIDCSAALQTDEPAVVCSILRDTQLLAGTWTQASADEALCQSPGRAVRDDQEQNSQITYLAEGVANRVKRVSLVVKINNPKAQDAAERELLRATNRLSVRLLGLSIPIEIRDALKTSKPANATVGSGSIHVYREQVKGSRNTSIFVVME